MDTDGRGILGDPQATGEEIRRAWEVAALAAMRGHRKVGEPVVAWDWETNQVVLIAADEFTEHSEPPRVEKSVHALDQ